jgi:hypothetical protein
MKINTKKLYPLIGIGIAVGMILLIAKKKPDTTPNPEPSPEPEDGSGVSPEQKKPDPSLMAILANANASTMLKGKKIYSKIGNIKARTEPRVNDGLVNNLYGDISNSGVFLGTAISVVNDAGGAQNTTAKRVFKWVKVQLSKDGYDAVQANRSFLTRDLFTPSTFPVVYFREDVIKL